MDKSCQASGESTSTSSSGAGRDQNCLNLSKVSHKISKPTSLQRKPSFDAQNTQNRLQSASPPLQGQQQQQQQQQHLQAQAQQHQPPVYNINKNDFRDVVQKLTGSPAHERFSNPPPIQPPKPQSSRLQRIRPPPLAHVTNRPPPSLNTNMPPPQHLLNSNLNSFHPSTALNFGLTGRPVAPLSPLPPLPTVHAAAESPVSAYMRYFHNSISSSDATPWNNFTTQQLPLPQQQQGTVPPPPSSAMLHSHPQFQMPPSPLAFGCLNSPAFSASLIFSPPTAQLGFPQLPLSPTVPASSPRWIGD